MIHTTRNLPLLKHAGEPPALLSDGLLDTSGVANVGEKFRRELADRVNMHLKLACGWFALGFAAASLFWLIAAH